MTDDTAAALAEYEARETRIARLFRFRRALWFRVDHRTMVLQLHPADWILVRGFMDECERLPARLTTRQPSVFRVTLTPEAPRLDLADPRLDGSGALAQWFEDSR